MNVARLGAALLVVGLAWAAVLWFMFGLKWALAGFAVASLGLALIGGAEDA